MTRWQYIADATLRSYGRTVLGGSPLRMLRVAQAGEDVIERAVCGEELDVREQQLVDRFVDAGLLHPIPTNAPSPRRSESATLPEDVTVVIPIKDRSHELQTLLTNFTADTEGLLPKEIVVVDDGSKNPAAIADVVAGFPSLSVRIVRHAQSRGPAAARMTGAEQATTSLVAYIDSDCQMSMSSLVQLARYFAEPRVALVAPRIIARVAPHEPSVIANYEEQHSPLDLGNAPARVASGTRVSYVPSAMMMVRKDELIDAGGFDEDLRVGEDVDLVWRLVDRGVARGDGGWVVRYAPEVRVTHDVRSNWIAWSRQRWSYGSSAALLDQRHPHRVAPVVLHASSLEMLGVLAALSALRSHRKVAVTVATLGAARLGMQINELHRQLNADATEAASTTLPRQESIRLVLEGQRGMVRQILEASVRVWWPVALPVALVSKRARPAVLAAFAWSWWKHARTGNGTVNPTHGWIGIVDDMSYGAGVWTGCLRTQSFRSIRPRIVERS